ncbi:MAG: cytochrome c-type biogenesis protein CcmH [Dehalococcoidia bacterium]|nr:cytochrome c-type biogenesis protein CcmH [Dehalococcoidia bacterium]
MTLRAPRFAALAVLGVFMALGASMVALPERAAAQVPATEEQAIAIERQLLCPICTNERLDVCSIAICNDMKRIIRERLTAGSTVDDIMLYFETRYGQKIRAEVRPEGFNLWLYGWIGLSVLAVGALGGSFLLSLRRRARPAPAGAPAMPPDAAGAGGAEGHEDHDEHDAWLDEQIAGGDPDEREPS